MPQTQGVTLRRKLLSFLALTRQESTFISRYHFAARRARINYAASNIGVVVIDNAKECGAASTNIPVFI